jgi:hypothetical protein
MMLGSVAYEPDANANGARYVWLTSTVIDRLKANAGPR